MNKHLIWVKANCNNYYNFISKLQYLQLKVYDIKYLEKVIYLKIDNQDFLKLQKYLVSYKFQKVKELGIYSLKKQIKKNYLLLLIIIFALFFYFLFTHLIVEINVHHENKEIRDLIEEELAFYGIKVLHFKKNYVELTKIKNSILDKYPDKLDWLEIEEHGMAYDIKVEERIITDTSKENKTCDLVARKSGIISNIKASLGEVVVDLNDYVHEGDTLISGSIMYNNEEKRNICASGEVYATVWYTVNLSIPFNYNVDTKTGKKKYNIGYEINGNKKTILKNRLDNFTSKYITLLKFFDFKLYLEKEYEIERKKSTYSEEEVINKALEKAQESISKKIGTKDHIIDEKVLKKNINNSTMDVEIFVIVEELISEEKITIEEENNNLGVD